MANPGEEPKATDDAGKPAPAAGVSKAGNAASGEGGPKAAPSASLNQLKPLVPRKQTMMGLGATKPPVALPTPLSGISTAMQRPTASKPAAPAAQSPVAPSPAAPTAPAKPSLDRAAVEKREKVELLSGSDAKPAEAASQSAPRTKGAAPRADAPSPTPPVVDTKAPAPETKADAPVGSTVDSEDLEVTTDLADDGDPSKAYVSPRLVPKAALPASAQAAKVLINLPDAKEAVEEERAREAKINAERRREPTVRIPRQAVESVRSEIALREARENGGPIPTASHPNPSKLTESEIPTAAALDAGDNDPAPSSSKVWIGGVALVVAAAAGAAVWFLVINKPATASAPVAQNDKPAAASTAKATSEPTVAAPPLELTADAPPPAASVVTHNAAAADGPPTTTPTTSPTATATTAHVAAPPQPTAPMLPYPAGPATGFQKPKPAPTAKSFTPSSI